MASGRLANIFRKIRPNKNQKVLQDLGMEPHEFLKAMDDPEFLNNLAERQSYIIDGVIHLDKYVETKLGEIPYTIDEMIPVLDDFSIAVQVVKPRGDRDFIALVTYGMSGAPLEQIGEDYKYAELMIKLPAEWKISKELMTNPEYNWAMKILRKSAYSPHLENFKIEEGAIIPFGKEGEPPTTFTPNTKLSSVLLIRSKELPEIKHSINTITYYTLVPISAEEEKLVKEIGTEKFMEMLGLKDVVDLNRKLLA